MPQRPTHFPYTTLFRSDAGERTITVIGEKHRPRGDDETLPWEELHRTDCVYFTGGDVQALRKARHARALIATARELPTLKDRKSTRLNSSHVKISYAVY